MRLLFAEKPAGVTTHTSLNDIEKRKPWVDTADGFLEFLQTRLRQRLYPIHRLDKETTGAIAFALDKESAELARDAFETRTVKKTYLFITDRKISGKTFETESVIERVGSSYVSRPAKSAEKTNSSTRFTLLRIEGRHSLWQAEPETGKPHQIRLHAESAGIPVLGDDLHGGSGFPALCLHSHKIEIGTDVHISEPPQWFENLKLIPNYQMCAWLSALDRRDRVHRSLKQASPSTFRWIHTEGDPLRAEVLGGVASLNWFNEQEPNDAEWDSVKAIAKERGWSSWYLQIRGDRGKAPSHEQVFLSAPPPPERWMASENDLLFEFRRDSGLSPGLFLDQRQNRDYVRQNSQGKRVLNLFSYTSGFSVAAVKGGASQVVSVDVSKTFLEWSKRNFELNGFPIEGHEFRAMDAREYLAWALKKNLRFDVVICDPPSFARGKKDLFRIEHDFETLLIDCLRVTASEGGLLLFSTNYEAWSPDDLGVRTEEAVRKSGLKAQLIRPPSCDWDFELPRERRNMKCVLIQRV